MKIKKYSIAGINHLNEDRFKDMNLGIYGRALSVSDGMGGKSCGDIAAEVVSEEIVNYIFNNYQGYYEKKYLFEALNRADTVLAEKIESYKMPMGAVVVAAIILGSKIFYSWQGNVRLYILHNDKLQCLTQDHVLDTGYGEKRLTRCIKGCGIRQDIPFLERKLNQGDIVYICTDGFYNQYEELLYQNDFDKIIKAMQQPHDDATVIKIMF